MQPFIPVIRNPTSFSERPQKLHFLLLFLGVLLSSNVYSFKIVVSDTAMYQQAGNSIVVDVLIAILKQMDITQYGTDL